MIEVDGVFHFPRNSETPLGKNILKFKVLEKLGYHSNSFSIPYFDWAILESRHRKPYVTKLIENALYTH